MASVFWDSNLFIYLLEDFGGRSEQVAHLYVRMRERGDRLVTSSLTIGEVLVKPLEQGNVELQRRFELVLAQEAAIQDLTRASARRYAAIRLDRSIRPQDAIQLACAAEAGVDLFI